MKKDKSIVSLFILSIGGVLFSGYLSGVKFFTETCAFNESCPYFLGYPACYFGFIMFLLLFIFSFIILFNLGNVKKYNKNILFISILGMLFAGYFTIKEIPILIDEGLKAYVLGLPTCALGLIFYIVIFLLSLSLNKNK